MGRNTINLKLLNMDIKDLLNEEELSIVLEALRQYEKRCYAISNAPMQGYGKVTEKEKRMEWGFKGARVNEIATRIAYEFI